MSSSNMLETFAKNIKPTRPLMRRRNPTVRSFSFNLPPRQKWQFLDKENVQDSEENEESLSKQSVIAEHTEQQKSSLSGASKSTGGTNSKTSTSSKSSTMRSEKRLLHRSAGAALQGSETYETPALVVKKKPVVRQLLQKFVSPSMRSSTGSGSSDSVINLLSEPKMVKQSNNALPSTSIGEQLNTDENVLNITTGSAQKKNNPMDAQEFAHMGDKIINTPLTNNLDQSEHRQSASSVKRTKRKSSVPFSRSQRSGNIEARQPSPEKENLQLTKERRTYESRKKKNLTLDLTSADRSGVLVQNTDQEISATSSDQSNTANKNLQTYHRQNKSFVEKNIDADVLQDHHSDTAAAVTVTDNVSAIRKDHQIKPTAVDTDFSTGRNVLVSDAEGEKTPSEDSFEDFPADRPLKRKFFPLPDYLLEHFKKRKIQRNLVFEVEAGPSKDFNVAFTTRKPPKKKSKPVAAAQTEAISPEKLEVFMANCGTSKRKVTDVIDLDIALTVIVKELSKIRSKVSDSEKSDLLEHYQTDVIGDISNTIGRIMEVKEKEKVLRKWQKKVNDDGKLLGKLIDKQLAMEQNRRANMQAEEKKKSIRNEV